MTTISSSGFNISSFQKLEIEVSNKKMTDNEITRVQKLKESVQTTKTSPATSALADATRVAVTGQVSTPQTATDTQVLGATDASSESAVDEFLDFTGKSWDEKIRAMILGSMGLEEEDLANMTPEEREKIEAKIKEKIDQEIEKKTGMMVGEAPATV
ncbi:MAG: hypothetical protein DI551_06250 [Micavibrio aeruginosavorus]|uniref:Uncharacterized protein n=1 Tax=Micavibrio aeruginosavorus TaxID=349221 RepID=A0A2W5MYL9_9BACT|nr:MAG: hypothetical protein DI551_06250 [Micavibrio aeruginosavorus]